MKIRYSALLVLACGLGTVAPASAADLPDSPAAAKPRFLEFFEPYRSSWATLSPDGRLLAYSVRKGEKLAVVIVETDHADTVKTRVDVGSDDDATSYMTSNTEKTPIDIRWMRWITPTRLAISTNRTTVFSDGFGWINRAGTIVALDADGKNIRVLATPQDVSIFRSEAIPGPSTQMTFRPDRPEVGGSSGLAYEATDESPLSPQFADPAFQAGWQPRTPEFFDFAPGDSESLIVRASGGVRTGFFKVNALTGKTQLLREEIGVTGMTPLFDRQGRYRGGIAETNLARPPYPYVLEKASGFGRARNLDEVAGTPPGSPGFRVSSDSLFGERAFPVGFDENPDLLYFASNIGRDTYGIYALDVKTGQRTAFALEDPVYDLIGPVAAGFPPAGTLVFDRYTRQLAGLRYDAGLRTARWLQPDLQKVQADLERTFPGRSVEIMEWDQTETRFLALVHGVTDPGSFHVYDRSTRKAFDLARRADWTNAYKPHLSVNFAFNDATGRRIAGTLTEPRFIRSKKIPIVVRCPNEPWQRVSPDFQPETQALANMGFAVVQIDGPGAWGFGLRKRSALTAGYEETQIADILATVNHLAKRFRMLNPERVALLGEGHGGYVALRGLQLQPDRFRCAVAINAPLDLGAWIEEARWTKHSTTLELARTQYGDAQRLKEAPLLAHPEAVKKPVCLLAYPGPDGAPRTYSYMETRQFAAALRRNGTAVEFDNLDREFADAAGMPRMEADGSSRFVELDKEFAQRLPRAQAAVYRQIEYFLNAYVYDYKVDFGPLIERKDD